MGPYGVGVYGNNKAPVLRGYCRSNKIPGIKPGIATNILLFVVVR